LRPKLTALGRLPTLMQLRCVTDAGLSRPSKFECLTLHFSYYTVVQ